VNRSNTSIGSKVFTPSDSFSELENSWNQFVLIHKLYCFIISKHDVVSRVARLDNIVFQQSASVSV
jgi:hypothetical protein